MLDKLSVAFLIRLIICILNFSIAVCVSSCQMNLFKTTKQTKEMCKKQTVFDNKANMSCLGLIALPHRNVNTCVGIKRDILKRQSYKL